MNNRVRTHVAALMLLVPAATVLVASPAAAQQRATVASAPRIDSFELHGSNRFEPGRELRFRLEGTPGARAWVDIPNVIRGLELQETRRGVYEGSYVVTRRDDRRDVDQAVASLQDRNYRVSARVALRDDDERRGGGRDNAPPQITELSPAQGARVDDDGRVRISARITDERRNDNRGNDRRRIDADDVRLRVNGRDVTADTRIRGDEVEYTANLPRGRHTAELTVRDRAGNVARQAWSFDVVERDRRAGGRDGRDARGGDGRDARDGRDGRDVVVPVPVRLTSPTADASWNVQRPTPIVGRTAPHARVHVSVDSFASWAPDNGQTNVLLHEVQADANGNFVVPAALARVNPMAPRAEYYVVTVTATLGKTVAVERVRLAHR